MPDHKSLILIVNDVCPLRCEHCSVGYSSRFSGSSKQVDVSRLKETLGSIDTNVYSRIILAGGEPSRSPDLLEAVIDACHDFGLQVAVTTAPVWAKSPAAATRFLEKIRRIDSVILSLDRFHLNHLDLQFYKHAIAACGAMDIDVNVHVSFSCSEDFGIVNGLGDSLHAVRLVSYQRIMPVGNASTLSDVYSGALTIETKDDIDAIERSCTIGNALVSIDCNVHACCWSAGVPDSPLEFGSFTVMQDDSMFRRISAQGFLGSLVEDAKDVVFELVKGKKIINECHLCVEVMSAGLFPKA